MQQPILSAAVFWVAVLLDSLWKIDYTHTMIRLQMLVGPVTEGGSAEAPFFFERRMDMPANKINDGSIVLIGKAMQQGRYSQWCK